MKNLYANATREFHLPVKRIFAGYWQVARLYINVLTLCILKNTECMYTVSLSLTYLTGVVAATHLH